MAAHTVWTRSRIRDALTRTDGELRLPAGAIVTPDARDLAQDFGLRIVVGAAGAEPSGTPGAAAAGFLATLHDRARRADRTIVLPEGTEPRICQAAAAVRRAGLARLILLGPVDAVGQAAAAAGLDAGDVMVVDPQTSPHRERFAARYEAMRRHKGVTPEAARAAMGDVTYFGTMMVDEGLADGLVSGAVHTTAHTVRPAFEIIKTAPGIELVSSAFLMCLGDQVLVFADCAVNPQPTAGQLAEIAVCAAATARAFGLTPTVAMLSYATHDSGTGPQVDLVRDATARVRELDPGLCVDGPLQYDAALVPEVAARKAPRSAVAGAANVLVFPDLSAGNIAYKAVQRAGRALAIGPVLQGLRKPVNDLSRGATVEDIVNTIAITAVQAAQLAQTPPVPAA